MKYLNKLFSKIVILKLVFPLSPKGRGIGVRAEKRLGRDWGELRRD
ncbi:MAG: hypothetical protein LBQ59_05885 [Candidatus Peribacteria bacterium]|jgi:hypothetical protein|nr:hypothetical protein [Candidatus Peribacteria bacterium]